MNLPPFFRGPTLPGKRTWCVLALFVTFIATSQLAWAQNPALTSATPERTVQGSSQVLMTLVGSNFRAGATLVISPPLASVKLSTGNAQASDIAVVRVTLVNSGLMTASIDISADAETGLRAIDVLNLDGTTTGGKLGAAGPGTSQPMQIELASSLAAPLTVLNMGLLHPRDGTVVMQGQQLTAEAILAGAGTGTVTGEWVWDGNVVEEFTASIIGGQSTTVESQQSLPTDYLGIHRLQLRMIAPNQVASEPVTVVVNPGGESGEWRLEQLILPEYGQGFSLHDPPSLLWAPVPGAEKYQVGFTAQSHLNTITEWFDVVDNHWQLPQSLWSSLPEGQLYWTVRTVDANGLLRAPVPLRSLYRLSERALNPTKKNSSHASVKQANPRLIFASAVTDRPRLSNVLVAATTTTTSTAQPSNPDVEAPPSGTTHPSTAPAAKVVRPKLEGQIAVNTQWASDSNPPDTNVLSAAEHFTYLKGPWNISANGSGLLSSVLNPDVLRTAQGEFNDYVLQAGYKHDDWSANLRFGIISPVLYTDARFVTVATPRQAVELSINSLAGKFSGFVNTDDTSLGGGTGISFHQQLAGLSYQAPLAKRVVLRAMWLNAQDTGSPTTVSYDIDGNPITLLNPITPAASGDLIGALLKVQITKKWLWASEYAISYDNLNVVDPTSTRAFGRAWRSAVTGQFHKAKASLSYRELSENFGNPANPALSASSQPNLRGVDASITDTTRIGNFGLTYSFIDNNVHPTTSDELYMNSFTETWSKTWNKKTTLKVESRQSIIETGTVPAALIGQPPIQSGAADTRDLSGNINLSRIIGKLTLTVGGMRDWSRDNINLGDNTITSSINAGATIKAKGFFQLNAHASANWIAADGATVGTTNSYNLYLQPSFIWKHPTIQLAPLVTVTKNQTKLTGGTLTTDTLSGQYGGRVTWTLPGKWKFNSFSGQGSYNQNHDIVAGIDQNTTELLIVWTVKWNHKHTF